MNARSEEVQPTHIIANKEQITLTDDVIRKVTNEGSIITPSITGANDDNKLTTRTLHNTFLQNSRTGRSIMFLSITNLPIRQHIDIIIANRMVLCGGKPRYSNSMNLAD